MASQRELGEHLSLNVSRVRVLVKEGHIPAPTNRRDGYDLDACRAAYIAYLRSIVSGHRSKDGKLDLTEERAKLARSQTEAQDMKLAIMRGEYIPAADNAATLIGLATIVNQRLQGVGPKVAPLAHAAQTVAEAEQIISAEIAEAQGDLADAASAVEVDQVAG